MGGAVVRVIRSIHKYASPCKIISLGFCCGVFKINEDSVNQTQGLSVSKPSPHYHFYHAHARHVFQAEELLSQMLGAGLTPNVVTYTSLMVVLRRGGQPEKCIKILDLMNSKVGVIHGRNV